MGRTVAWVLWGSVVAGAGLGAGCGGGGGGGGGDPTVPAVVSVRFVGPNGADVGAIHKDFVPRNAWIELLFTAELDPKTVVEPGIKVRAGPYFDQPSLGTFHVQGHRVLFDPTLLGNGGARPFGFDAEQTHHIEVPTGVPSGEMVRSSGGVAPVSTFTMDFRTTTNFVRDDVPPRLVTHRVVTPLPDPDGRLWSNTILELEFDEAIDPRTIRPSLTASAADPIDSLDIRFAAGYAVNEAAGVAGRPIPMQAVPSADAKRVRLVPLYPLATGPYVFEIHVLPALRDLAGNAFSPAAKVGPFTCVGEASEMAPTLLAEAFWAETNRDPFTSELPWGEGSITGVPVTSRRAYVLSANYVNLDAAMGVLGARLVSPLPLIGADLDAVAPQAVPSVFGRRLQLAFDVNDLGPSGTITSIGWGPDRNATFVATYPAVTIRLGTASADVGLFLTETFADNSDGPLTIVYQGPYNVAQRANVGNEAVAPAPFAPGTPYQPLFDFTGFVPWPALKKFVDWDTGPAGPVSPRAMILEVDAVAGSTWQECRAYFRGPLAFPGLIPQARTGRRLVAESGGSAANPPWAAGAPNPDPTVQDTAFTISKVATRVQSRFYTPDPVGTDGLAYPPPYSTQRTFGTKSDYGPMQFVTSSLPTGTDVVVEYQGATVLDPGSSRTQPDLTHPTTPWTTDPDDCDGYPYVRWRITLRANPVTGERPTVGTAALPIRETP